MPTVTGIATSFIDFTRASNATVTDSDGKVKWAPHNLLLASESFDAAAWTKSSVTPTANSIAAPNGTTTADTLAASGANGTTLQTFTAEAISYTFGVWLKRKTGTGNIQIAADSGTYTTVTITSDWALYTVTQTPTAGSKTAGIRIVTSADEVYAWGASLYRSDLAMQPNTSAYPLYNPTTPKNFAGFTEDFSNTAWSKPNVTIQANATIAPNGLNTADLVYPSSTGVARTVYQSSLYRCVSVYAKGAGKTFLFAQNGGSTVAWFNLATGAKGTVVAGYTADMTPEANGFYRCSVIKDTTSFSFIEFGISDADNSNSVTANGTDGIYLWGAQLSDSASLDSYVPVYGAAVTSAAYYGPRRDFDPVTLACKGLLVEEQRTNALTYSAQFDFWSNASGTVNVTLNATTAPDGAMTADKLVPATGTAYFGKRNAFTSVIGTSYTFSIYAKESDAGVHLELETYNAATPAPGAIFNLSTGAVLASRNCTTSVSAIDAYGFRRYSITFSATAAASTITDVKLTESSTLDANMTGNDSKGIIVWGAQVDDGSFATSYIPVGATSAGATRNADVASVSTQAFPYNQAEGSVVVNGTLGNTSTTGPVALTINDGTANNEIYILQTVGTGTRRSVLIYAGGAQQAILAESLTNTVGLTTKAAGAFKVNDVAGSIDGGTVVTDTPPATIPTVNTMRIGNVSSGNQAFNGWIRQITYLPRRISNAELVTRST